MTNNIPEGMKPVLVTTEHRGVFGGLVKKTHDQFSENIELKQARMAIYWATTKGVLELAIDGPNENSRISIAADIALRGVTMVVDITPEAWSKWTA